MIGKSIKYQLTVIGLLFSIFVAVVLFQFFYTYNMQTEEISKLQESHKIISDYLYLAENERDIIDILRNSMSNKKTIDLPNTIVKINDLNEKLKTWHQEMEKWRNENKIPIEDSVFNSSFIKEKQRGFNGYEKAVKLCKGGKFQEANAILNIETAFLPSAQKSIISILNGIELQIQNNRELARRFYMGTVIAIVMALIALLFVSMGIFKNMTSSLKLLEEGAQRISNGDFSKRIKITSPVELSSLANSFNEMQAAIKNRDEKIREDADEIQKLNEILEQKVVDRNKTIMQQNVVLKRKNEELEQILYAASHDLRTPLISIQGFSEELKNACNILKEEVEKQEASDVAKIQEIIQEEIYLALNYIINGSKRMETLLEGLLRISRMGRESLQIVKIDMNELLENVSNGLTYQLNETETELKIEKLNSCKGDTSLLEQVFTNFISNAIKYRSPDRKCKIKVYSKQSDGATSYFVEDNGIGIPPESVDRVFHAFFRVDDEICEGDGVGLAIVNRAVDLHSGRAWVESELGKGSIFAIEIPDNML
jgi:signal transduction histidine kinase